MNRICIYQVPQAHKWLKILTQLSYMPEKTWILYNDLHQVFQASNCNGFKMICVSKLSSLLI